MRRFKIGIVCLGFITSFFLNVLSVSALSNSQIYAYSQNSIMFYKPGSGCGSTSSKNAGGNSDGSDVYVIGDSITHQSQNDIREVMDKVTINAQPSIYFSHNEDGLVSGVDRIGEMGNQNILVFALGTNGGVNHLYKDDTQKLLNAVNGKDIKVILMTIYYSDGYASTQMTETNKNVRQLASQYSNITIMDWAEAAATDPATYIREDHTHLTPEGQKKFAEVMKAAVDEVTTMGVVVPGESSSGLAAYQIEFVELYHDIAVQLSIEYGIPWETVMSQGILESASGTSFYATDRNNFFGIGAFDSNPDNAFHYDTPEDGWRGYYENIRITATYRNHGVFTGSTVTDPYEYLVAIKEAGYATAPEYVKGVGAVIKELEVYMAERGWASSAELAAANPVWFENAARNAEGADVSSTAVTVNSVASNCSKGASVSGESDKPIGNPYETSVDIACDSRTTDLGVFTGYAFNSPVEYRLCALNKSEYQIVGHQPAGLCSEFGVCVNYAVVNSRLSGAYAALAHRYYEQYGRAITSSNSFRTKQDQEGMVVVYKDDPNRAARVGESPHQAGTAIDFYTGCEFGTLPSNCHSGDSDWLGENVGDFGLMRRVDTEPWHVDPGKEEYKPK